MNIRDRLKALEAEKPVLPAPILVSTQAEADLAMKPYRGARIQPFVLIVPDEVSQ